EEVFQSIRCRWNVRLNSFITLRSAIIIGNRLLIYIAEAGTQGCIEEHLPVLVAAGKQERDERGLNRFRLVLTADDPVGVQRVAEKIFEELRGTDDKLHLHMIRKSDMPFTAENAEGAEGRN
ncbi:MAG TPA: hypothetical protein VN604_04100, partial [Nitrospirota bacterium]|nr:hypothetical protein [Nitrospirota bacterium]